ncbi:hypothetical protein T07_11661 [Trichinella nelsoni]|uniref:Uncharacterized protein n=1 Tax=Trichinella nelsoni TaxID=6336 RepID=A0A0V0S8J3_9BILA|nr:hypothetical protein T07_11661 [Trichinella nelsoni]
MNVINSGRGETVTRKQILEEFFAYTHLLTWFNFSESNRRQIEKLLSAVLSQPMQAKDDEEEEETCQLACQLAS